MIYFKENHMREEFHKLDKKFKNIVYVIDSLMSALYGLTTMVTSVYRDDKSSPHHYYRAVDIRSKDLKDEECMYLGNIINLIFPYNKGAYQTLLYHNEGKGWHMHVQVKP